MTYTATVGTGFNVSHASYCKRPLKEVDRMKCWRNAEISKRKSRHMRAPFRGHAFLSSLAWWERQLPGRAAPGLTLDPAPSRPRQCQCGGILRTGGHRML